MEPSLEISFLDVFQELERQSIKRLRKKAGWDDLTLSAILVQKFS